MKILLDTNILLGAASGDLPPEAVPYIENKTNTLLFSSACLWEVAVKRKLGIADFAADAALLYSGLISAGYQELPITGKHTLLVSTLPMLHKDPFDRIMLAQSAAEGIPLLTSDELLLQYPVSLIYVG